MRRLVIFGTGDIAQIAAYYFEKDTDYDVAAFTVDQQYIEDQEFEGKPVVAFERLESEYPAKSYEVFIAVSYAQMNHLRQEIYNKVKTKGYKVASYVSPACTYLSTYPPGENAFIFEDNTIQPFVKIGTNVTIWSGNHIGHHSEIEDHNFISSHVVISGHCRIKPNCFLGVNSTIGHKVTIADGTLVGAGVVITKDTSPKEVLVAPRPVKLAKSSDEIDL